MLFRSTDRGLHYAPISPDLTRNVKARQGLPGGLTLDVTGAETFDTILAVAPSPHERGTIWVGTDDGLVRLTRDEGKHWARRHARPGSTPTRACRSSRPRRARRGTAYAAVDRHFVGDRAPYVYATDDYGRTWRRIASGLPRSEVHVVREDPRAPNVLYAGTGKGVWWSRDRGASWSAFPAPLPAVEVRDLVVSPGGDLIAATHGRGLYVFDDLTALTANDGGEVRFFTPREALPLGRVTPTVNVRGAGADAPAATFTFWQRGPAAAAPAFEIVDRAGRVVRRIAGTHDQGGEEVPNVPNLTGYNRVTWSLDRDPPTPWRRVAPWNRGPESGPPVPGGSYTVRLVRDGRRYERTIVVRPDPRAGSAADERAGDAFALAMYAELSRLDEALNALDNLRLQLPARSASSKDPALAERARAVLAQAQRVEGTLSSQPLNDQDDDFLEDLLRERVLTFVNDLTPGAPPQAQLSEGAALRRESEAALAGYRRFVAEQVRPLDAALRAAGLAPLDLNALPAETKPDPDADEHARRGDAAGME